MIQSMTGFGRGVAASAGKKISVEIKSLNSKQLDLMIRVPQNFRESEISLRQRLSAALRRGKAEVSVQSESTGAEAPSEINLATVKAYKEQIEAMGDTLGLEAPEDWYGTLLRLPEVFHQNQSGLSEDDLRALDEAMEGAIAAFNEFRTQEGRRLDAFFREKLRNIADLLVSTENFEAERVPSVRKRLEQELEKLQGIEYDRGRLEQEMIFYIEKLDVNEEKLRLRSHLNYFAETLDSQEPSGHGKKLGFIAQEMGREINTLGSKSNNAGMQRCVVMMKDELEQIKEQVLNVL